MITEFLVEYELYDTTALQDGVESSSSNQEFSDISLMKEQRTVPSYGTLEQNFFELDGSKEEMPDMPANIAYYSQKQADEDGSFMSQQSVTVQFSENHTSVGLTLYFEDVWPLEIEIAWYDLSGILKSRKTYYPNSKVFFAENQVEDYGRVVITFTRSLPFHNVKMSYIEYGTTTVWGSDTIKSGKLTEETDPISNTIKVNKLEFSFVDKNDALNIGNPAGLHKTFQKNQKINPYEIIDGIKKLLGVYFLDTSSTAKNLAQMTAYDMKGLLDNATFTEGRIYEGEPAGNIIDEIMTTVGISNYEIDDETRNVLLYGTLKIQTCRKALREVLFACGSLIDTSRRDNIYICKSNRLVQSKVERSRKFTTTLQMDSYVSDVSVKYKTWTLSAESKQITKGTYKAGTHTITLTNPASNMVASVGNITKQMPYYLVLELENDSEVEITGQKWEAEELSAVASVKKIKAGEIRTTKNFTGTLLDFSRAQEVAESILDYYQLQHIINIRYVGGEERPGSWVEIGNPVKMHGNLTAGIESLITDLTGGFIQTAKCRGYYKLLSQLYYSEEIFANEEVGIL